MNRILIVDDEILVRVGLRALMDWPAVGWRIVGEAASGSEALALLPTLRPDIVLTDLVMGPGDGFDLVRGIRKEAPETGIIILSCRNDFEAVREALRLGADDYVFKLTMKGGEILEVLDRVLEKKKEGRRPPTTEGLRDARPSPEESSALARWLAGEESCRGPAQAEAEASPWAPWLKACRLAFFCLASPSQGGGGESPGTFRQAVRELKRRDLPDFEVLPWGGGRVLVAVKGSWKEAARDLGAEIGEYAERYFGRPAWGGVSSPISSFEELRSGVGQAEESLAHRFFVGPGLSYYEDLPEAPALDEAAILGQGQAFRAAARALDGQGLEAALKALFAQLGRARLAKPERIRSLAWDFLAPLREEAGRSDVDLIGAACPDGEAAQVQVLASPDLPSLEAFATAYSKEALGLLSSKASARCRPEILRVLNLIAANLSRNISVEEAASVAAMSTSHFEHLFKKEIGESFVRHMTRVKMERAEEILRGGGLRIYEIARDLGYENPNYFSTLFRQWSGRSPQEARDGIKRGCLPAADEQNPGAPPQET